MTDADALTVPPAASPRRGLRIAAVLTLLVLLALSLWATVTLVQRFQQQETTIRQLAQDLNQQEVLLARETARQADLTLLAQRNSSELANFSNRLDGYDQTVGQLTEQLQGGRVRIQLATVEHLLMAANERLLLNHDVDGALIALTLADERLGRLNEPRLFRLREAIAREKAAVAAIEQTDLTSVALTLASLSARAPKLPLAARVPDRFETRASATPPILSPDANWMDRLWSVTTHALSSVFTVRRAQGIAPRLLPPEEEALILNLLQLRLEGIRAALLRRDTTTLRDLCVSTSQWLRDYFRAEDPGVMSAQAELERLRALDLSPELPDLTRSLTLLRGYLASQTQ